jgi:hypothetical protein
MNIEKNNLTKLYSINYCPNNIEFNEISSFYQFDSDCSAFKSLLDVKRLNADVHGFYIKCNYKKYLKP